MRHFPMAAAAILALSVLAVTGHSGLGRYSEMQCGTEKVQQSLQSRL